MDDIVKQLKERIDLRDVITLPGDGGRRSGDYKHGLCPFHEADGGHHKSESFMVYPDHYRCLSPKCNVDGDIFNWIAFSTYGERGERVTGTLFNQIKNTLIEQYLKGSAPVERAREAVKKPQRLTPKGRSALLKLAYACYRNLGAKQLMYYYGRGFSPETIQRQLFGYDGRYVIPIWEGVPQKSKLLTLRFRSANGKADVDGPRYSGIRDTNEQLLYNREALLWAIQHTAPALLVFYGELDAGLAWQDGFPAVSPTNGALSFLSEWVQDYPGPKIIIPDKGEEKAAYVDANEFDNGQVAHFPIGPFKDYGEFRKRREPIELTRCIYRDTGIIVKRRKWLK